jgi:hypothetical protein
VSRLEVESAIALASASVETEDFAWRIALLKDKVAEVRQDREVAEENSCGLSDAMVNTEGRREESER